ncbi:MAG: 3-deoxy-8-phosphooctulonate synthase [Paludibacteraceae bacterium]|nr:3-deoxy-8-phosphooctulonate synthase [Paludibacteraceae bacterium]
MFLIAGPCAIESRDIVMHTAETLKQICERLGITLYFKSSYDKANRTSMSERGVGMEKGLEILQEVKSTFGLPILTDVHESWQCTPVAEVADVLQIPAFLSRQTDLLVAAAKTGKVVNVKKGQFMAPWDMRGAIAKIEANHPLASSPNNLITSKSIWLTERGSSFGYGNLIVDMTSLVKMREYGYPVVFDATHSVQQPSSQAGVTGGNREMVPHLIRAAVAVGIDGLFLEVHPQPEKAISDAANQVRLSDVETILKQTLAIDQLIKKA